LALAQQGELAQMLSHPLSSIQEQILSSYGDAAKEEPERCLHGD